MSPLRVVPQTQSRSITFSNHGYADTTVYITEPGVDGHAAGAFTIDFSDYPDGPVPEAETGLRDNFLDDPDNEDEMGIRDGKLAVVEFRGPDQAFSGLGQGGGRRGFLWRNTATLTDDVSAPVEVPLSGAAGNVGGAPLLHINNDFEGSEYVGVSCWFVPAPFSWTELGVVGRKQEQFAYLELAPATTMPVDGDDIFLRSVGGQVALEVNGVTVCGPCDLPAGLLSSAIHGVQMDTAADADEGVGMTAGVTVGTDATALAARAAPATPAIGSPVEANATSINVPYPTGISAGHTLYAIMATKNGGTFSASGWTQVPTQFGVTSGIQICVLKKTAVGSESGSLTVTKSVSGVCAGVMLRVTGDRGGTSMTGQGNGSASTTVTAPAFALYGPYRTFLFLAAIDVDANITAPAGGWFPLSTGLAANQAIRLHVSVVVASTHSDYPDPPIFNAYENDHFPSQVTTCGSSATSAAGVLILQPAFG